MGLKERLIALAAGDGNLGNLSNSAEVTGKIVSNQRVNPGNPGNLEKGECAHETAEMGAAEGENRLTRRLLSEVTEVTEVTSLKPKAESGNLASEREVTEVTGRLVPAGDVALGPDDPGDEGLEWCGEVEDVPPPKSDPEPHRPSLAPPVGSLKARLVAVGATVNAYGKCASVRAPAGIPLELVKDVEARGWRIIPGGKANPEAEHDSWLACVPIAELER
jgi:hypothetical protein